MSDAWDTMALTIVMGELRVFDDFCAGAKLSHDGSVVLVD